MDTKGKKTEVFISGSGGAAKQYSDKVKEDAIKLIQESEEFILIARQEGGKGTSIIHISSPLTILGFLNAMKDVADELASAGSKILLSRMEGE